MKRFAILFAFLAVVAIANAQVGRVITVTASEADSSKGAETDYITIPNAGGFTSVADMTIQVLCTQLGGTSDGKITLQKSVDGTTYVPMLTTIDTDLIVANDTATITNGAAFNFRLKTYGYKYRLKIEGTSGDSTVFTTKYLYKPAF